MGHREPTPQEIEGALRIIANNKAEFDRLDALSFAEFETQKLIDRMSNVAPDPYVDPAQ